MAAPKVTSRRRINVIVVVLTVLMAGTLIFRVGYWQVVKADDLKEMAADQWTKELPVAAKRGDILDTNGKVMAQSASAEMVVVSPKQLETAEKEKAGTIDKVADTLATELDLDKDSLLRKLKDTKKSEVLIKRQISREQGDRLREIGLPDETSAEEDVGLPGVHLSEDMKRFYPLRNFLTQVLGFTSVDGDGLEGIEARFNKYLAGSPGKVISETDASGNVVPGSVLQHVPAIDGQNVVLTIDSVIQSFVEKAMDRALTEQKAKKVTAIVMDTNTGAILAMVNKPDFDNNAPPRDDMDTLRALTRNSAIADSYEPGSTFKVLTLSAALDSGAITTDTTFYCPGYKIVDGEKIKCWSSRPHGSETLYQGVQKSCNPVFMEMALRMGRDTFYQYLDQFGIGKQTGIDLAGEASGIMMAPKYVRNTDLARIGFGQSIAVTPLQLVTAVSAAVNGGNLMTPYIVSKVTDINGQTVNEYKPTKVDQVIKPETSAIVRDILLSVVEEGSGKNAKVEGYKIGGKTGTAQKYGPDGKIMTDRHVASFVAFAPADKPKYTVLVIVDEPDVPVDYGSLVAAPYVKMILEDTLKYAGVRPEGVKGDNKPTVEVPDCTDQELEQAADRLNSNGFQYIVEGYGGKVVDQMPKPGDDAAQGSTVMLYLEQEDSPDNDRVELPDLTGKTATEVNTILASLGLQLKIEGTGGVAVAQDPPAMQAVNPGSIVEVTFKYSDGQKTEEKSGEDKNNNAD